MSAWHLFSTLGFYPVAPGSGQYALGSPLVHGATLHLEGGKDFVIQVRNQSAKNVYVQQVTLNGQKLMQPFLAQQDVAKGGTLVFTMGARPVKQNRK
jgi:putative alpha-1,2-mannosidase